MSFLVLHFIIQSRDSRREQNWIINSGVEMGYVKINLLPKLVNARLILIMWTFFFVSAHIYITLFHLQPVACHWNWLNLLAAFDHAQCIYRRCGKYYELFGLINVLDNLDFMVLFDVWRKLRVYWNGNIVIILATNE